MAVSVELPDELAERLRVLAAAKGITIDQAVVEAIRAQLPVPSRLSFAGIGDSGHDDTAEHHREIIDLGLTRPDVS
jgi:hypothetical protein